MDGGRGESVKYPMQSFNWRIPVFIPTSFQVPLIEFVFVFYGDSPQMPACPHGHVYNTASPDIDSSGIELAPLVFLRGDIWSATAKAGGHVGLLFPGHTKALA